MALQRTRVAHTTDKFVVVDHGDPAQDADGNWIYTDDGNPAVVFEGADLSGEEKAKCLFESMVRNEKAAEALRNAKTKG